MANINPQISTIATPDFHALGTEFPEKAPDAAERDAILFTTALRGAHNAPDIRTQKVEDIRARIANGTYAIDAKRIAAALLREDPELFRF